MNPLCLLLLSTALICTGCSSPTPTDQDLKEVQSASKAMLLSAVVVCQKYEALNAVESPASGLKMRGTTPIEILSTERELLGQLFDSTRAEQIDCLKLYKEGKGRLVSVRFDYFSRKFGMRSELKAVEYIIEPSGEWLGEKLREGELRQIDPPNWYIYEPARQE